MHHEKFISTSKQLLKLLKRLKFLRAMGPSRPQGFACSVAAGWRPILHHPGPDEMVGLPRPRFKTVCGQPPLRSDRVLILKKIKIESGRSTINCVFGFAEQTHKRRASPIGNRGNAAFGDIDFIRRRFL